MQHPPQFPFEEGIEGDISSNLSHFFDQALNHAEGANAFRFRVEVGNHAVTQDRDRTNADIFFRRGESAMQGRTG